MYRIFVLLICFVSLPALTAQGLWEIGAVKGIWVPPEKAIPSKDWKAQWIWLSTESPMMLSRKSFELSDQPQKAILKITATSQYKLYVNGQYIIKGPARSAPHHQSFDQLDVTRLLQKGRNTIAVKVHYQAGKQSYHFQGRPGLLAQLNMSFESNEAILVTNESWKVKGDPSWDSTAPVINRFQDLVNDKVDLRQEIKGWYNPTFDDLEWVSATLVFRNVGWPSHQKNNLANALIISDRDTMKNINKSARNIKNIKLIKDEGANIYDLFKYKNVIMTSTSIKKIQNRILNEKN